MTIVISRLSTLEISTGTCGSQDYRQCIYLYQAIQLGQAQKCHTVMQ